VLPVRPARDRVTHAANGRAPATWIAWRTPRLARKFGPTPWVYVEIVRTFPVDKVCIVAQGPVEPGRKEMLSRRHDPGQIEFLDFARPRLAAGSGPSWSVDRLGSAPLDWHFKPGPNTTTGPGTNCSPDAGYLASLLAAMVKTDTWSWRRQIDVKRRGFC